jgi:PEP-CTERM motif
MKSCFALAALVLSATGFLLLEPPALADTITLTLAKPTQHVPPGATLSYFATVSAPATNTGFEFLNGAEFTVAAHTTLDDSGYFNTFPLELAPGQAFTGLLFTITFLPPLELGDYPGTFSITGGPTDSSNTVLATVSYDAQVTPEPSTLLLLSSGLAGLAIALRGRRNNFQVKRT